MVTYNAVKVAHMVKLGVFAPLREANLVFDLSLTTTESLQIPESRKFDNPPRARIITAVPKHRSRMAEGIGMTEMQLGFHNGHTTSLMEFQS